MKYLLSIAKDVLLISLMDITITVIAWFLWELNKQSAM